MNVLVRTFQSGLSLLLTRAEFASVELSLVRAQFMRWLLLALGASVLAMLGLIALSALIALLLWDRFGWIPLGLLGLGYCLGAALLVLRIQSEVANAPPLLSETFVELAKDRAALFDSATSRGAAQGES
jgi:uncharacterized membrane protein YqjE